MTERRIHVYALGIIDYDVRVGLPIAVFSTLEAAQAKAPKVEWEQRNEASWMGTTPAKHLADEGDTYIISRYEIDGPPPGVDDGA